MFTDYQQSAITLTTVIEETSLFSFNKFLMFTYGER